MSKFKPGDRVIVINGTEITDGDLCSGNIYTVLMCEYPYVHLDGNQLNKGGWRENRFELVKEENTMNKEDALTQLKKLEEETKRLRAIIEAPEPVKLKKLDWSKMPKGTLVSTEKNNLRYFDHCKNGEPMCIVGGGTYLTVHAASNYSNVKLVENPEFTFWQGGGCPFPQGVMVEYVLRNGQTAVGLANELCWDTFSYRNSDIIAYRVVGLAEGWEN